MRSDVDDVAAVDMAATEDNSVGKGINDVMASTALIDRVGFFQHFISAGSVDSGTRQP